MSETSVKLHFDRNFRGRLIAQGAQTDVGEKKDARLSPYDLLLGALGACFYHTFVGIADKKRLVYERAEIAIHGVKREEVPTTLKEVTMDLSIFGAQDQKGFERSAELAAKYCSVHETVSKVADITLNLHFKD
ncbi:MAG: OsmC family protein [Clostridiales bacterium]|nr:OsmC family protein [Clostridiales bacterium]